MKKQILVSGIRSTGELHLGNYYGAMQGIIDLQNEYSSYFFIADLHSLTTHPKQDDFKKTVFDVARNYLSAGLDPDKSTFYAQSSIAEDICELHTYLSMIMPLGELMRCPTFKEKAKLHPDNVNYGLVGYPVLMAADILIHKGAIVPVGEDQLVHLEIVRSIVRRFNNLFGELFSEPLPVKENAVRIPSLTGQGKMSKSAGSASYLTLDEDNESIKNKINRAYSDPSRIYLNQPGNPTIEGCNVYHLHTFFTDYVKLEDIAIECQGAKIGCVQCKNILAESISAIIDPIRERRKILTNSYIHDVLLEGRKKAKESSERVIAEVRKQMGIQIF